MPDFTHPSLTLHGHHVPEEHRTVNTDGTVEVVQLPGVFQIWAEVEGQHKLLTEFKAGKLVSKIEKAREENPNPEPPAPPAPPAYVANLYDRIAALEAQREAAQATADETPPQSPGSTPPSQ